MDQTNDRSRHFKAARALPCLLMCLIFITAAALLADHTYAAERGPAKIKGVLYFLNSEGKPARSGKERTLSCNGLTYYVLKSGKIKKGWNVIGKNLYYFSKKTGAMVKNRKIAGITLLPDGKAQKSYVNSKGKKIKSLDVSIRIKCIKVLKKRGVFNKSKKKQLRSAWVYLTDRKTFHYSKIYPNLKDPKWTKKYANRMLSSHGGNCYGYACTFSAFAWTIGYDPYVCAGRCPGSRDGAGDGYTRHCLLKIKGRWYDPEYWAIYRSHYLYGAKKISYSFKNRRKPIRFRSVKGTVASSVKTISGSLKKIGKRYYYFTKKGKARKGLYYIKGHLYRFTSKGKYGWSMTVKSYKKVKAASAKGKPYSGLVKLIGKAGSYNDECDELSSRTYMYKHVAVNVIEQDGVEIIQQIFKPKQL